MDRKLVVAVWKAFQAFAYTLLVLATINVFILFFAMAQYAIEGRTGYWNGFWSWQAQQVVKILK